MSTYLFDLILIGMSVYVLVSAILGRGRLFQLDNLKEGMEEKFYSGARKLYLGLGTAMLINSIFSLLLTELYTYDDAYQLTVPLYDLGKWSFLTPGLIKTITYIALAAMIGLLIWLGVFMSKVTDRNAPPKKNGSSTSRNPRAKKEIVKLPSHAFDFDSFEDEAPAGEENKA